MKTKASQHDSVPPGAAARLRKLRYEIDSADKKMLKALVRRFKIVEQIGQLKRAHKMKAVQNSRMKQMMDGRRADAIRLKLDPDLIDDIFDLLHEASIDVQKKILKTKTKKKVRS